VLRHLFVVLEALVERLSLKMLYYPCSVGSFCSLLALHPVAEAEARDSTGFLHLPDF